MNDYVRKILKHPKSIPISVSVISFSVGLVIGYFVSNKRSKPVLVGEILDTNQKDEVIKIEKPKQKTMILTNDPPSQNLVTFTDSVIQTPMTVVRTNQKTEEVDNKDKSAWDYEKELKERKEHKPYILHKDEFFDDKLGYTQLTVTYFAGDDILVDDDEKPMYNYPSIVGDLIFGHGSGDPNVLYVRNDQRKTEYEIIFDPGLYSVEVLGLEIENNARVEDIKHSKMPRFRIE